jgi:hypothetical protein
MNKKWDRKAIDEALGCSPLDDAEKITGKPYQEEVGLSLELVHRAEEEKEVMFRGNGDTYHNISSEEFIEVIEQAGFVKQYEEPLIREKHSAIVGDVEIEDRFCVYYKKPGVILVFDTWKRTRHINRADIYYNWIPNVEDRFRFTSSGRFEFISEEERENFYNEEERENSDGEPCITGGSVWEKYMKEGKVVWIGNHDAREGLVHKLTGLEENGRFLEPWAHNAMQFLDEKVDVNNFPSEVLRVMGRS